MSEVSSGLVLAKWLIANYPYRELTSAPLTHLKLQKLCFFGAGCAWAVGEGSELSSLRFEAWKHGPVLRDVFGAYTGRRGELLPEEASGSTPFGPGTARALTAALRIYGPLSAWALREQSHLETPWLEAKSREDGHAPVVLSNAAIKAHFSSKYAADVTAFPEYLADGGVFRVDGVPFEPHFASIFELADHVERAQRVALKARFAHVASVDV